MPWYWPFKRDDETYSSEQSSLIEGISDDSLLLLFVIAGIIGLWIYYSRLDSYFNTFFFIDFFI
jgi:hypothetical protein